MANSREELEERQRKIEEERRRIEKKREEIENRKKEAEEKRRRREEIRITEEKQREEIRISAEKQREEIAETKQSESGEEINQYKEDAVKQNPEEDKISEGSEPDSVVIGAYSDVSNFEDFEQAVETEKKTVASRHKVSGKKKSWLVAFLVAVLIQSIPLGLQYMEEKEKKERQIAQEKLNEVWNSDEFMDTQQISFMEGLLTMIHNLGAEDWETFEKIGIQLSEGIYAVGDFNMVGRVLAKTAEEESLYGNEVNTDSQGENEKKINFYMEEVAPAAGSEIEEGDLEEGFSFIVYSSEKMNELILWCDTEKLVGTQNCEIFCFDGQEYIKLLKETEGTFSYIANRRSVYSVDKYQMFWVEVSNKENKEEYPILILPVE